MKLIRNNVRNSIFIHKNTYEAHDEQHLWGRSDLALGEDEFILTILTANVLKNYHMFQIRALIFVHYSRFSKA